MADRIHENPVEANLDNAMVPASDPYTIRLNHKDSRNDVMLGLMRVETELAPGVSEHIVVPLLAHQRGGSVKVFWRLPPKPKEKIDFITASRIEGDAGVFIGTGQATIESPDFYYNSPLSRAWREAEAYNGKINGSDTLSRVEFRLDGNRIYRHNEAIAELKGNDNQHRGQFEAICNVEGLRTRIDVSEKSERSKKIEPKTPIDHAKQREGFDHNK